MNQDVTQNNSLGSLLHSLRDESTTLLRQEVALAKAEVRENISQIGNHVAQIAIGGFVAYAGVIVLLIGLGHLLGQALVNAGVEQTLAEWLAPAIVGFVVAIIGWGMISRARRALGHDDVSPRQTTQTVKETARWAEKKLQPSP